EKEGGASNKEDDQNVQDFRVALDNLLFQQKEGYANSTNKWTKSTNNVVELPFQQKEGIRGSVGRSLVSVLED
ncbi:hypothetical protein Tco_0362543, partial [Tanacetum coccineum]